MTPGNQARCIQFQPAEREVAGCQQMASLEITDLARIHDCELQVGLEERTKLAC
jgi:hypothetical protein